MTEMTINGDSVQYGPGQMPATLAELLRSMKIAEATVVAEVDGRIIERGRFDEEPLRPGQKVELIRFVGGG